MNNPIILDGKKTADKICIELRTTVKRLMKENGIYPKLTIVTSGHNDAGEIYVRNKKKRCEQIGIDCNIIHFDTMSCYDVIGICANIANPIIFQLPIVSDESNKILDVISHNLYYKLDADGFASETNVSTLASFTNYNSVIPCTPAGIMHLLNVYRIPIFGKSVCIIGRSNIVGRPLFHLMEQHGATPTLCHSSTPIEILINSARNADIIVSATGVRNILTLKDVYWKDLEHKTLVDVGINKDESGKICGDFDPELFEYCYAYTPTPGGVGPMTVAMLMKNVVEYYLNLKNKKKIKTDTF